MEEEDLSKSLPKNKVKGKWGSPKFTHTPKPRAEQKESITLEYYRDEAQPIQPHHCMKSKMHLNSCAASTKCSKRKLEQSLGVALAKVASGREEVAVISQKESALKSEHWRKKLGQLSRVFLTY